MRLTLPLHYVNHAFIRHLSPCSFFTPFLSIFRHDYAASASNFLPVVRHGPHKVVKHELAKADTSLRSLGDAREIHEAVARLMSGENFALETAIKRENAGQKHILVHLLAVFCDNAPSGTRRYSPDAPRLMELHLPRSGKSIHTLIVSRHDFAMEARVSHHALSKATVTAHPGAFRKQDCSVGPIFDEGATSRRWMVGGSHPLLKHESHPLAEHVARGVENKEFSVAGDLEETELISDHFILPDNPIWQDTKDWEIPNSARVFSHVELQHYVTWSERMGQRASETGSSMLLSARDFLDLDLSACEIAPGVTLQPVNIQSVTQYAASLLQQLRPILRPQVLSLLEGLSMAQELIPGLYPSESAMRLDFIMLTWGPASRQFLLSTPSFYIHSALPMIVGTFVEGHSVGGDSNAPVFFAFRRQPPGSQEIIWSIQLAGYHLGRWDDTMQRVALLEDATKWLQLHRGLRLNTHNTSLTAVWGQYPGSWTPGQQ